MPVASTRRGVRGGRCSCPSSCTPRTSPSPVWTRRETHALPHGRTVGTQVRTRLRVEASSRHCPWPYPNLLSPLLHSLDDLGPANDNAALRLDDQLTETVLHAQQPRAGA